MWGMNCLTTAISPCPETVHWKKLNLSTSTGPIFGCFMMTVTMRDRSKNRKPLQKGRNLSIEAIQTVQALKRASNLPNESLEVVFKNNFRRLLKFDMIAVLCELLRQDQCLLALQVFEDIRKENWYIPQLSLYVKIIAALGRNGLVKDISQLIIELKSERFNPNLEDFNALLESLLSYNLTGLSMECFYLMKSLSCDPDRLSFTILINGLRSYGETEYLGIVKEEARRYYGDSFDLTEKDEACMYSEMLSDR